MRVSQQFALYDSEQTTNRGQHFTTWDELEGWVRENMLDAPWWHEQFPWVRGIEIPRIVRRDGEGSVGAYFADDQTGQIEMHRDHWCAKYLCHEVAHVVSAAQGSTSHDPIFARNYMTLVYLTMGSESFVELREAFIRDGIEFG